MTAASATSYLAFALLCGLLILLGTRFEGLASARDSGAFRLVISILAGAVGFYLLLALLDAMHVPWHPLVLVGTIGVATAAAHGLLHSLHSISGRPPATGAPARMGWGDGVALLALLAFAWFAVTLCIAISDFYFHWGLKGERFFLARGIDYEFLAAPWNEPLAPHYPLLLPDLYAATALVAGRFAAPAMMLWSVGFFALLLLAGREALGQAGVGRFVAEATLAVTALAVAAAAMRGTMAGGADWMISLGLVAAMPALLRPPDRIGSAQIGVAAAFAAASKTEGTALAAILISVQCVRMIAGTRSGRRIDFPGCAALVLPAAAVVGLWQVEVRRHHLLRLYYGGIHDHHAQAIWSTLRYELTRSPIWHGFAYSLLALPLLCLSRRLRPVAAVIAMQVLFYLYAYFAFLFDPVPLILTTFDRLELHVIPAILLGAGVALDPLVRSGMTRGVRTEMENATAACPAPDY